MCHRYLHICGKGCLVPRKGVKYASHPCMSRTECGLMAIGTVKCANTACMSRTEGGLMAIGTVTCASPPCRHTGKRLPGGRGEQCNVPSDTDMRGIKASIPPPSPPNQLSIAGQAPHPHVTVLM